MPQVSISSKRVIVVSVLGLAAFTASWKVAYFTPLDSITHFTASVALNSTVVSDSTTV